MTSSGGLTGCTGFAVSVSGSPLGFGEMEPSGPCGIKGMRLSIIILAQFKSQGEK